MCDYSLESYKSVDAQRGETYTLRRFPSGTKGFTVPATDRSAPDCAVCLKDGTLLHLDRPSGECLVGVFAKIDPARPNMHHDGLRFSDGSSKSLQELPDGTKATVLVLADATAPEDGDLVSRAVPETPGFDYAGDPITAINELIG